VTRSELFAPARFASLAARNRIAMPAMHLGRAIGGRPTEALLDLYEARSRGGVGIITVGVCGTGGPRGDGGGALLTGALSLADDGCVEPMAELAGRIRTHGALAGVQLAPLAGYNDPRWRPDLAGVREIVEAMARAAARAEAAGFHFAEVMLSGGSALSHFVSKAHNTCGLLDYSGSLENRLRLPVEIIAAMRGSVGEAFVIGARMHCHEFLEGGFGEDEAAEMAKLLERAGARALNITGGGHRAREPQVTHQVKPLAFALFARRVAKAVGITTSYGGQIRTLGDAEAALVAVGCDFVNVGRALLADPEWAAKLEAGDEGDVVPCMTCCRCLDDVFSKREISCAANPRRGGRRTFHSGAPSPKKILVVGAGPAGMEAALALREAGCETALLERADEPGGRWRVAAMLEGMSDLRRALDAEIARVVRAGIDVRFCVDATPEIARAFGADAILLAVGAARRRRFSETHGALTAEDANENPARVGRRVAIVGGGAVGLSLAVHLKKSVNAEVAIVKRRGVLGRGIGRSVRWTVVREAHALGVRVYEQTSAVELAQGRVSFLDERAGAREALAVDTIVLATGYEPPEDLAARFEGAAKKVVVIGDARSLGGIGPALADAHRAVREILG